MNGKPTNCEDMPLLELVPVQHTIYFRDGKRKIDAILVYQSNKHSEKRDTFIANLKAQSLQIENEESMYIPSRVYVKVHAPWKVLEHNAKIHGIPVKYEQITILPDTDEPYGFMKNILNDPTPHPNDPITQRARETILKQQPRIFTTCERNSIVFTMMQYTHFGDKAFNVGLSQLLLSGEFIAAYPLHDGQWQWPINDSEPLNDRQLLAQYWANFRVWYKEQPLDTIEKYFGPEIAMYFSWLGFYNKMLIVAAIFGILTSFYGILNAYIFCASRLEQVCQSDLLMCPHCRKCKPKHLKAFCWYFKVAHLTDNIASVLFACAMSCWATLFMEFWKRKQNTLYLRWNLNNELDDVKRPQFQTNTEHVRAHPYTGEMEIYIPIWTKIIQYSVSIIVIIFMMCIVLTTILGIIIFEVTLKMMGVEKAYITITSACLTVAVMMALKKIYGMVAMSLTYAEVPRTQLEFDKSYMIKMVLFSTINNYGKLIYMAFFKGKFYTYPGDQRIRNSTFPLAAGVCDPTGCVSEIFVLLAIITVVRPIISNFFEFYSPRIKLWMNKMKHKLRIPNENLQIWEQDFDLNSSNHYRIMEEVEEIVMQYGFVTLLVAAFPLAPLFALLNNVFEIRIDSNKVVKYFRRSQAVKATSINVWFDTLQAVTYIAIITNALFITFTSNFIPEMVYYLYYRKTINGFFAFQLSKYKVVDDYWYNTNITECYYSGHRYPPEHIDAYQYDYIHYVILSFRLGFALVFILLILTMTAILAYAIPDIPSRVKELLAYNARKLREKSTE